MSQNTLVAVLVCTLRLCFSGAALLGFIEATQAQPFRDPTQAPASAGLAETGVVAAAQAPSLTSGALAVVVREGVYYLVQDTRLLAQGQYIGQARIERITETEIWLRQEGIVRKVPVFDGIERRVAQSAASAPKKAPVPNRSAVVKP